MLPSNKILTRRLRRVVILFSLGMILTSATATAQVVATAKYNGKWGFIDNKGKWYITPQFDSVENFYNGFATIYMEGRQGMINERGEVIIRPECDYVGRVSDNLAEVFVGDNQFFFDVKSNAFLEPRTETAPAEKLVFVTPTQAPHSMVIEDDLRYVYVYTTKQPDATKQPGVKPPAPLIGVEANEPRFKVIGSGNEMGLVNSKGDTVLAPRYEIFGFCQDSLLWFMYQGKYGVADLKGRCVVKPVYDFIDYYTEGLAPVMKGEKWGFLSLEGKDVIGFHFDRVMNFKNGLAAAESKGKWGFIDHTGAWVIKPIYEDTDGNFRNSSTSFDPLVNIAFDF
jgi:hypothetical protein